MEFKKPKCSTGGCDIATGVLQRPPATFGRGTTVDYRKTFFEAHPALQGKVIVHHAVEQQVLKQYPGVVSELEIHSLENLRGVPKCLNPDIHLSKIRKKWNWFYMSHANASKQALLDFATEIDNEFGQYFTP